MFKAIFRVLVLAAVLLVSARHARAQAPTTPTTHRVILTWTYTQGNSAAATQFNIYRALVTGGCNQIAPVPPSTISTFPAGCTNIGAVPASAPSTYTDQGNAATNLLPEGTKLFYVVVSQGSTGLISADSNEASVTIPFTTPAAPQGLSAGAQ